MRLNATPVCVLVRLTFAPGMTALEASCTVPVMVPRSDCATAGTFATTTSAAASAAARNLFSNMLASHRWPTQDRLKDQGELSDPVNDLPVSYAWEGCE